MRGLRRLLDWLNGWLTDYLSRPIRDFEPAAAYSMDQLRALLQPGDVLLIEGNLRISSVIKYITQSTWSHVALYVGPQTGAGGRSARARRSRAGSRCHPVPAVQVREFPHPDLPSDRTPPRRSRACRCACTWARGSRLRSEERHRPGARSALTDLGRRNLETQFACPWELPTDADDMLH